MRPTLAYGVQARKSHQKSNIDAELVNLLYTQAPSAILGSFLVASGVLYMLHTSPPSAYLTGWYLYMCALTAARYGLIHSYALHTPSIEKVPLWYWLFVAITGFSSLGWVLLGTLLFPSDPSLQALISIILAGISAGGVPYFSGSRLACAVFTVPILLAFSFSLIWHNSQPYYSMMAILSLVYLGILLLSSLRTYQSIFNSLLLRFENIDLIEKLDVEIGERRQTELLLRQSKAQYALIMDAVPGLIGYLDAKFRFRFANKAFENWFEKPLTEILGKHIKDIFNPTDYETLMANYSKLNAAPANYETVMKFQNDKERYVSVTVIPHEHNKNIHGLYLLINDVTPRINYLATHDPLTNLPNRSLFMARFARTLKHAKTHHTKVALLFLDLDYFKNINDTLGHDVGDELLIQVTERLQAWVRKNDTIARLGGDEFTIIFEDVADIEAIKTVVNKICRALANPFHLAGREIFITTSIGISLYPNDGNKVQTLLKNADIAMYQAKEQGRNTFEFYTQEMIEKMSKTLALEAKLRSALEKNQFHIYYQPIVDMHTGKINKMEALLRWECPEIGFVAPSEFIPLAEKIGLAIPIGEWVLHTVCMQSKAWQKANLPPLRIAINISAQQFKDYSSLLKNTAAILEETGIKGEYITIEITESSIIDNIDYSIKTIEDLKKLNITISLDDFGTGYSSLNYLNRLPVDTIKIDRSFITNITTNERAVKIVTAIITMAHALTLKVIAEGVETLEQYLLLKRLNCDAMQGHLFSPPIAAEDIPIFQKNGFSFEGHLKKLHHPDLESAP